jgi:phosphonopyruvate decarboxylase
LIMIGWRGEPGIKDEPQHIHQGRVMIDLIESMNMPYEILEKNEKIAIEQTNNAIQTSQDMKSPFFLIVKKNSFDNFSTDDDNTKKINLSREEAIISAASNISNNSLIVSTTGMPSRELFEHRASNNENHNRDFLTVGGMGHASQISLGIALQQKNRNIYCFDGDGAAIMHMGSFAVIGQSNANNLTHIIFNNGAHDSVGGQPTVGLDINFCAIAKSCGYKSSVSVDNVEELNKEIIKTKHRDGPYFIEVIVKKGNRSDLGRPTRTPSQNKLDLINYINLTNS